jgi:hypothetical protein
LFRQSCRYFLLLFLMLVCLLQLEPDSRKTTESGLNLRR